MTALNLVAALALLLWGCAQVDRGLRRAAAPWLAALGALAGRSPLLAAPAGLAAGALQPASADRAGEAARLEADRAFAWRLGAQAGAAALALVLVAAPAWAFQVLTAGGAAALLLRPARWHESGRALLGAGLALLGLQLLELAAAAGAQSPFFAAVGVALGQDAWLSATLGALAAVALRSLLPVVLALAVTWGAWLPAPAAVAMLLGAHVGAALAACAGAGRAAEGRQVAAAHLVAVLALAAAGLLLRADLALLPAGHGAVGLALAHLAVQAVAAAAFAHLAGPLTRTAQRWLPARAQRVAAAVRLPAHDLATPSLALTAALREVMRLADLVDRMLQLARDGFLRGDPVALQAARHAEQRVNQLYLALKQYLAQVPRQPLSAPEQVRWQELLAFLVAAEQVADRVQRMVADVESKKIMPRVAYPAAEEADVLALHDELARNLRAAAAVCLERRAAAARELACAREAFRRLEQGARGRHVARLVAGDTAAAAASALHFDLLADYVDMNDQVCAFARGFLELRSGTAPADAGAPPAATGASHPHLEY